MSVHVNPFLKLKQLESLGKDLECWFFSGSLGLWVYFIFWILSQFIRFIVLLIFFWMERVTKFGGEGFSFYISTLAFILVTILSCVDKESIAELERYYMVPIITNIGSDTGSKGNSLSISGINLNEKTSNNKVINKGLAHENSKMTTAAEKYLYYWSARSRGWKLSWCPNKHPHIIIKKEGAPEIPRPLFTCFIFYCWTVNHDLQ